MMVLLGLLPLTSKGQAQKIQLGASGGLTVPFVDFADAVQSGIGGSLIFKYFATEHIALGGNVGYYKFPGRDLDFGLGFGGLQISPDVNIIPVNATAEWFIGRSETLRPRLGVDMGVYFVGNNGEDAENKAYFGFSPVIGSGYRISEKVELFADTKFNVILTKEQEDIPTTSYLSVNVGVMVNIGK